MSLRSRIVSLLFALVLTYAIADHWIQRSAISPIFEEVERDEARKDLARVQRALQQRVAALASSCRRLAVWDPTHAFTLGTDAGAAGLDLGAAPLDRYEADLLCIADARGELLWSAARTPDMLELTDVPRLLSDALILNRVHRDLARDDADLYVPEGERAGLRSTPLGPMIVASEAVLPGDGEGAPSGVVLAGRLLTEDLRRQVAEQTQVSFELWPMDGSAREAVGAELVDAVTSSVDPVLRTGEEVLHACAALEDMRQAPAFLLRAAIQRRVSGTGQTALDYALNSTLAAGLILLLALVWLLQRTVLRPLSVLTAHAVRIGQTEDLFARLDLDRGDELGILSREFDNMTARLARSRAEVVTAARAAGMSEIATGILHNVGNVLNSVNISATLVGQNLRELAAVDDLAAVVQVLEQQGDDLAAFIADSPQGRHLTPFLRELADTIAMRREEVVSEAASLVTGIDHIRELIQSQQSYAGRSSLVEPQLVGELLEEAFTISDRALSSDPGLTVEHRVADIPRALVDRHKVLEILVNLIQNARQAMLEAGTPERQLVLRAALEDEEIVLEVQDSGIGFDDEVGARIFTMGFTTKSSGHGFGLHASANAARELGGSLTAASPGPGKGACFTLRIPFRPATSLDATT